MCVCLSHTQMLSSFILSVWLSEGQPVSAAAAGARRSIMQGSTATVCVRESCSVYCAHVSLSTAFITQLLFAETLWNPHEIFCIPTPEALFVLALRHTHTFFYCTSFYLTNAFNLMINMQTPFKLFFLRKKCDICKKGMCETLKIGNICLCYLIPLILAHLCFALYSYKKLCLN